MSGCTRFAYEWTRIAYAIASHPDAHPCRISCRFCTRESLSIHPTWVRTQVPTDLTTTFNPWYNMVMATIFESVVVVWGIGLMVYGGYKVFTHTP